MLALDAQNYFILSSMTVIIIKTPDFMLEGVFLETTYFGQIHLLWTTYFGHARQT